MESLINFLLNKMYEITRIPKSVFNERLNIESENEWNRWVKRLNDIYKEE